MNKILIIFSFFFLFTVNADTDIASKTIKISLWFGENMTNIDISIKENKTGLISMDINRGWGEDSHSERELNQGDVDYILSKVNEIPASENFCYRYQVSIETISFVGGQEHPEFKASACLEDETETAKKLISLADLMVSWI